MNAQVKQTRTILVGPIAESVRKTLAGNLYIDQTEHGLRLEDAVMYIAGAQLKAIAWALAADEAPGAHNPELWGTDGTFSREDAVTALGGVAALLRNAKDLIALTQSDETESETTEKSDRTDG